MERGARRAAPWRRLLLLAVLLPGIVTMHTLGRPTEPYAMEDGAAAHSVALTAASTPAAHREPHHSAPPRAGAEPAAGLPGTPAGPGARGAPVCPGAGSTLVAARSSPGREMTVPHTVDEGQARPVRLPR
ncbi:hypothetical protein [Streptomyces sp. NPDC058701]|uniref:hypothetical protein n=1 Tax=Streptomyces sp. NPDC058701 TaxID=3346608 RepID=UPI003665DC74